MLNSPGICLQPHIFLLLSLYSTFLIYGNMTKCQRKSVSVLSQQLPPRYHLRNGFLNCFQRVQCAVLKQNCRIDQFRAVPPFLSQSSAQIQPRSLLSWQALGSRVESTRLTCSQPTLRGPLAGITGLNVHCRTGLLDHCKEHKDLELQKSQLTRASVLHLILTSLG